MLVSDKELRIHSLIIKIWGVLSSKRKNELLSLIFIAIIAMVLEVIAISSAIPFINIVTNKDLSVNLPQEVTNVLVYLSIKEKKEIFVALTVCFVISILLSAIIRIMLLWTGTILAAKIGNDFSNQIFLKILHQPYEITIAQDSGTVISTLTAKIGTLVYGAILPIITIISTSVLLISIIGSLIYISPIITLALGASFSIIYYFVMKFTRSRLIENGREISNKNSETINILNESIGGIRDLLIDGTQKYYFHIFSTSDWKLRYSACKNLVIGGSPRYLIEAIGIILIALVILNVQIYNNEKDINSLPLFAAIALGAQRILPIIQQLFNAWSSIEGAKVASFEALKFIDEKIDPNHKSINDIYKEINFESHIELKNITFSYKNEKKFILNKLNLKIEKGSKIGIMGDSGVGKSTLMDILLCLLEPSEGEIIVDNINLTNSNKLEYQKNITHVPQNIYISNASVIENIAFAESFNDINNNRLETCCKMVELNETINSWENKYETIIGERGSRLSGGQKQRIGLARALYKQKKLIVLDEATSALDRLSEKKILNTMKRDLKDTTIIHISHRRDTLDYCDRLLKLQDGKLIEI